jgi:hypothetical protein
MNSGYYGVPSVNEAVVANGGYWQPVDSMLPTMTTANSEGYSQIDPTGTTMSSYPEFSVVPSVVSSGSSPTTCVTTDSSYRHPGSPASSKGGSNGRRRAVNRLPPTIDPCLIAPLKKRRIDENRLPNTEREKLVMKREKNRDAAAKCRMKKKAVSEKLREVRVSLCTKRHLLRYISCR